MASNDKDAAVDASILQGRNASPYANTVRGKVNASWSHGQWNVRDIQIPAGAWAQIVLALPLDARHRHVNTFTWELPTAAIGASFAGHNVIHFTNVKELIAAPYSGEFPSNHNAHAEILK